MEREDKAKVVASVWGLKIIQFLAGLAVFPMSIWKKRLNSSFSSKSIEAKQLAWQGIEQIWPANRRDDLCLVFCFHPSSMIGGDQVHVGERQVRGIRAGHARDTLRHPGIQLHHQVRGIRAGHARHFVIASPS